MSSPQASPTIVDADEPYGPTAFADTILRTSDNVHFYVLGNFLCYVSQFFRDLFDLNRGAAVEQNEKKGDYPVIPLLDDSATLRLLLDLIHPRVTERWLDDVTLFWNVSKAAKKYCMDIIEGKLRARILTSELINEEPFRIYVVATHLEWDDVADIAARKTSEKLKDLTYVDELQGISGAGFYRFMEYKLRCEASAQPQEEHLLTTAHIGTHRPDSSPPSASENVPSDGLGCFRSSSTADLVLRSSDSIDFFITGALVRVVSSVFDEMFPLKEHETKDGWPVICVQESSRTLHPLLRIVYHDMDELDTEDWQLYRDIVLAVRKYKMASIERKLRKQVTASSLILNQSLRIYILATMFGWKEVQKAAVLNMLSQPLSEMAYISELSLLTGADLYRLVRFRFDCGDEACKVFEADRSYLSLIANGSCSNCGRSLNKCYNCGRTQLSQLPILSWKEKLKACPRWSTITDYARNGLGHDAFSRDMKCVYSTEKLVEEAVSRVCSQCYLLTLN